MSKEEAIHQDSHEKPPNDQLDLNRLTVPIIISHVKSGNTMCSSDNVLLLQDGSTTIEFRSVPEFKPKRISWRFGLIRDIVWCSNLNRFIILTRDAVYSVTSKPLFVAKTAINKPVEDFKINMYSGIQPYDNNNTSFWRCTCAGTTLYIAYSGYGTVIDEYSLKASSCEFVNRWIPPKTCAPYEGIWCIRHQPETDHLGFSIMDARNNQWRMEVRSRDQLAILWRIGLPIANGDCEISPLPNEEWLVVNSCGVRLIQIANQKLKAAVEYERELKNTIAVGNSYIIVRTKTTIDIHHFKQPK